MKGQILDYDPAGATGVISGEDGKRYGFSRAEWKGAGDPRPGTAIDFEARASEAVGIYAVKPAVTLSAIDTDALRFTDAVQRAGALLREGLEAPLALFILLACFLTFLSVEPSVMGMAAGEAATRSYSLFGAGSDLLKTIDSYLISMARSSESDLAMATILLQPRWLAPITAVILLYACWRGRPSKILTMIAGAGAIVAFLNAAIFASMIEGMANGSGGMTSVTINSGTGAWLLLLCGIGLILAATGRIANPLASGSKPGG